MIFWSLLFKRFWVSNFSSLSPPFLLFETRPLFFLFSSSNSFWNIEVVIWWLPEGLYIRRGTRSAPLHFSLLGRQFFVEARLRAPLSSRCSGSSGATPCWRHLFGGPCFLEFHASWLFLFWSHRFLVSASYSRSWLRWNARWPTDKSNGLPLTCSSWPSKLFILAYSCFDLTWYGALAFSIFLTFSKYSLFTISWDSLIPKSLLVIERGFYWMEPFFSF